MQLGVDHIGFDILARLLRLVTRRQSACNEFRLLPAPFTSSRTECSMKLDRLSPSCSTASAEWRSSGLTRSDGKVAVFIVFVVSC